MIKACDKNIAHDIFSINVKSNINSFGGYVMKLNHIGFGGSGILYPCYSDENGKLYFDINDGNGKLNIYTGAYMTEWNEICGEPCTQVTDIIECENPFKRHPREKDFMLLGRLKSDCDYFLGAGNGNEKVLYYKSVKIHCDNMEKIWESLPEEDKPEWLSMEQIKKYRKDMMAIQKK